MTSDLEIGVYRHYKGALYEVIGVARHSETLDEMVVYRALYNHPTHGAHALWIRPKDMFCEMIKIDGVMAPRFTYIK